jgi:hypothetical protein
VPIDRRSNPSEIAEPLAGNSGQLADRRVQAVSIFVETAAAP